MCGGPTARVPPCARADEDAAGDVTPALMSLGGVEIARVATAACPTGVAAGAMHCARGRGGDSGGFCEKLVAAQFGAEGAGAVRGQRDGLLSRLIEGACAAVAKRDGASPRLGRRMPCSRPAGAAFFLLAFLLRQTRRWVTRSSRLFLWRPSDTQVDRKTGWGTLGDTRKDSYTLHIGT